VPGDDGHVMYVWIDALTNYISAVGYPDVQVRHTAFRQLSSTSLHR
jgi:methionyl-tRNA synthetase